MTRRFFAFSVVAVVCLLAFSSSRGAYPQPSGFPVSWELSFDHAKPKRLIVQVPGDPGPTVYWYMTYHVANNTDRDKVTFYPKFEMLLQDGTLVRSDFNVSPAVFNAIKNREHMKYLQDANHIGGDLLQGEDQSRDGVAIWPEPSQRLGTFNIFATGFWGEVAIVKVGDKDVTLHKTMQLTYHANGDSNALDNSEDSTFIMR
jgi:hypothetical protein